jgi:hypothetical protein
MKENPQFKWADFAAGKLREYLKPDKFSETEYTNTIYGSPFKLTKSFDVNQRQNYISFNSTNQWGQIIGNKSNDAFAFGDLDGTTFDWQYNSSGRELTFPLFNGSMIILRNPICISSR